MSSLSPSPSSPSSYLLPLLYGNLILYSFFFWFNQPIFPYLSKSLGARDVDIGYLSSFNQLMQFVGSLIIGRIVDTKGGKFALILSHVAASIHYFLLFYATNIPMLFASKIPTVFMSAMQTSQTMAALITSDGHHSDSDRSVAIGRLSLMYGIGFVFGPLVGGIAVENSYFSLGYSGCAIIATVGEAIIGITLWKFMPRGKEKLPTHNNNTNTPNHLSPNHSSSSSSFLSSVFGPSLSLFSLLSISSLLSVKCCVSLCVSTLHSAFAILSISFFHLSTASNGYILSLVGILTMAMNGLLLPLIIQWGKRNNSNLSLCPDAESLILQFIISHLFSIMGLFALCHWFLFRFNGDDERQIYLIGTLILIIIVSLYSTVGSTLLTSLLAKRAPKHLSGSVIGMDMALSSLMRIISPLIANHFIVMTEENHKPHETPTYAHFPFSLFLLFTIGIAFVVGKQTKTFQSDETQSDADGNPMQSPSSLISPSSRKTS